MTQDLIALHAVLDELDRLEAERSPDLAQLADRVRRLYADQGRPLDDAQLIQALDAYRQAQLPALPMAPEGVLTSPPTAPVASPGPPVTVVRVSDPASHRGRSLMAAGFLGVLVLSVGGFLVAHPGEATRPPEVATRQLIQALGTPTDGSVVRQLVQQDWVPRMATAQSYPLATGGLTVILRPNGTDASQAACQALLGQFQGAPSDARALALQVNGQAIAAPTLARYHCSPSPQADPWAVQEVRLQGVPGA